MPREGFLEGFGLSLVSPKPLRFNNSPEPVKGRRRKKGRTKQEKDEEKKTSFCFPLKKMARRLAEKAVPASGCELGSDSDPGATESLAK